METLNRKKEQALQSNVMSESGFCNNCGHNGFGFEKVDDPCEQGLIQSFDFEGKDRPKPESPKLDSKREETYFEKLRNMGTNLRYNLEEIGGTIRHVDGSHNSMAYLLGKGYLLSTNGIENTQEVEEMTKKFSEIIWFSYRRNFPKLNYELNPQAQSYVNDTSWGCMIRACQMMFAEILKRCFEKRDNEIPEDEMKRQIIEWFLDTELDPKKAPYSIQNISRYLNKHFKLEPGLWLKSSNVLFALQGIQKEYGYLTVKNLETEIYIESTIYVTNALKKMVDEDIVIVDTDEEDEENGTRSRKMSENQQSMLRFSDINLGDSGYRKNIDAVYLETPKEVENLLKYKWDGSLVIFILAKTGLEKPNPEYNPFIKELLSYPESVGMIAGKPGLAYYIVGYSGDRLMYFDPHFVQDAVQKKEDLKEHMHTYFKSSIRHVGINEIDTSVTFGFYIKDEVCFKRFLQNFRRSCGENESFFGVELNEPQVNGDDCASIGDDDDDVEGGI